MKFRHVKGSVPHGKGDLLAFCVFEKPTQDGVFKAADSAVGKLLSTLAREQQFTGKDSQSLVVRTAEHLEAKNVAVIGLGSRAEFDLITMRDAGARAAGIASRLGAKSVLFALLQLDEEQRSAATQMVVEGALLGCYRFDKYRTRDPKPNPIQRWGILSDPVAGEASAAQVRALRDAIKRGTVVAEAVSRARDFINEPAGFMTPTRMAEDARELAKKHEIGIKVLGRRECEKLGMGMFLAVAKGSTEEPRFIHMTYKPRKKPRSKIAIIGKGVMFDSGGYSLKPPSAMEDMKMDMSGAAAVIAAMGAVAQLGSEHEVHAIAACCENLVSGSAYKLRDVLTAMDGTTVEINNTDAEGRLTLGDAITYARTKIGPDEILDFATLTGACMVALGPYTAGVMSDSPEMVERWLQASRRSGEDMWRLPLDKRLKYQLKSSIADMRNTGERWGGALTAGMFLQHFVKDSQWVHVDIAGPAMASRGRGATPRGGTGFATATIIEYLTRRRSETRS